MIWGFTLRVFDYGDRVFAALRRAFLVCVNENSFGISFLRTDPPFTAALRYNGRKIGCRVS